MEIAIDKQNLTPRIKKTGVLVYSELTNTLFIKSKNKGVMQIGSSSSSGDFVEKSTTIDINGVVQDLSTSRTWTIFVPTKTSELTNDSGFITTTDLSSYLTITSASATYQPIGSYLTSISGLNISQLTNDSGYITSSVLSPYLTSALAASIYQPILVSGTNIKTINGASVLGSGNITITSAPILTNGSIPFSNGSTLIEDNSNLFWDNTNKRLGIGTNTPVRQLEIKSSDSNSVLARMLNMSGAEFIWGMSSAGYSIISNAGNTGDLALRMAGDDNKFRFKPSGRFGIGVVNPTALLHITSGTATANTAPLKLTAGTNLTTPEAGAVEYDGSRLYHTNATAIREAISGTIFTQTASTTVVNTVTETSLIGTGVGTLTLPANFLVLGKTIRITSKGFHSSTGSTPIRIRVKLGSTTVLDTGSHSSHNDTNALYEIEAIITCRTTGASGTVFSQGVYEEVGSTLDRVPMSNTTTTTINTTTSQVITITVEWGTADSGNTITSTNTIVEILN